MISKIGLFPRNVIIASFYIILVIRVVPSQMVAEANPLYSGIMIYQMIQVLLSIFDGIDSLTGNRITGGISWTYHLITNGTQVVTGTVPFPALAFLAYKLPTAVNKISKKLNIEVKDMPKVLLNQRNRPNIKRWRRF